MCWRLVFIIVFTYFFEVSLLIQNYVVLYIRKLLIIAKVSSKKDSQRILKGIKECGKGGRACPYIKESKNVKINKKSWTINKKTLDYNSFNLIYAVICQKENCQMSYIRETKIMLKSRLADHCGYVRNNREDTATNHHFISPGHSLSDIRIIALEQNKR